MAATVTARATLYRQGGRWHREEPADGQISMKSLYARSDPRPGCQPTPDGDTVGWVLTKGGVHPIDDEIAAELARDGFGAWLGPPEPPAVTVRKRTHEPPRNLEAEIDELRGLVASMGDQVGEILALLRPKKKAG